MQLSRKHYEEMAEALYKAMPTQEQYALEQWERLVEDFVRILTPSNDQFNPTRFRKACGK